MIQYDLDDEEDNVANYLILSLQTEKIIPQLGVNPGLVRIIKLFFLIRKQRLILKRWM